jgi:hypothetical protein
MSTAHDGLNASPEQAARERLALGAALALIVVWGANFSVQKAVFQTLGPGGFLFVRYLVMPGCTGPNCRAPRCWRCSSSASLATSCTW